MSPPMRSRVMGGWMVVAIVACAAGACRRSAAPAQRQGQTEIPLGDGGQDEAPSLPFVIDRVYEQQAPADSPPWHQPGGDWRFFDARIYNGARFGFGYAYRPQDNERFAFGRAVLTVPSADDGAALVEAFGRIFHGQVPPPRRRTPLHPRPFSAAVLGADMQRSPGGGFGPGGSYTTMKLFLQRGPSPDAEVFFNFSVDRKDGELSEKDAAYADALTGFLTGELRDGPRPRRTPATDANVTDGGPRLGPWRPLRTPGTPFAPDPSSDGRYLMTVDDAGGFTRLVSVAPDGARPDRDMARVQGEVVGLHCAGGAPSFCALQSSRPAQPGVLSAGDPQQIVLLDAEAPLAVRRLGGPWGDAADLASPSPIAPDGSFLALDLWRGAGKADGGVQRLIVFVTRSGAAAGQLAVTQPTAEVVGWRGRGPSLRAVVRMGDFGGGPPPEHVEVDPRTGASRRVAGTPEEDAQLSPDGRRRAICRGRRAIAVIDRAGGRERIFPIPADDQPAFADACVRWVSPRFLEYGGVGVAGFLDVETMKVNDALGPDPPPVEYTKDFRFAVRRDGEVPRFAPIIAAPAGAAGETEARDERPPVKARGPAAPAAARPAGPGR
jgi:hypothetical protein